MKLLMATLSFLIMTSCTPVELLPPDEIPTHTPTQQPDSLKSNTIRITIGSSTFTATLATSAAARAFKAMLPLTLNMSDFNNNEKVCALANSLTTAATNVGAIHTGDVMLYGSSSLVLFYETFSTSYSYTKIGRIDNVSRLKAALGSESVTVKFE